MRAKLLRTEGAVKANGDRPGMPHGIPEGFDRVAGKVATGQVRERHRHHDGQVAGLRFLHLLDGHDPGLGIQGVEHGFDQDEIDAAFDQCFDLFPIDAVR